MHQIKSGLNVTTQAHQWQSIPMSTIAFSSMPSLRSLKNQSRMKPLPNKAEILSMGAYGHVFWSFVLGLSLLKLLSSDNV